MRVHEFVSENADTGAYQQMQQFVKANHIPGIPQDQQVALALFKELQKQKAANAELDAELDAAEQRIDQATQTGKLQSQELGMHQTEIEKEREVGKKQQAQVGQLGQQYAERERASQEEISNLTNRIEAVKNKPGVDPEVATKLEKQIRDLEQSGVGADKVAELEQAISTIQSQKTVDIEAVNKLEQQFQAAQSSAQAAQEKLGQVDKYQAEIDRLNANIAALNREVKTKVEPQLKKQDQDIKSMYAANSAFMAKTDIARKGDPAQPYNQQQLEKLKSLLPQAGAPAQQELPLDPQQQELPLGESLSRAIAWATGKTK